jgi:hypothetical protein
LASTDKLLNESDSFAEKIFEKSFLRTSALSARNISFFLARRKRGKTQKVNDESLRKKV